MNRKKLLATSIVGLIVSVIALTAILLIHKISNLWLLVPEATLIASIVGIIAGSRKSDRYEEEEEEREPFNWPLFFAILLSVLFGVAIVIVAIYAGWLALIPAIGFFASLAWLFALLGKGALKWAAILGLVISIILFGVYAIMGTFAKDANNFKKLVVDELVVNDGKVEIKDSDITIEDNKVEAKENKVEEHHNTVDSHDNKIEKHNNTVDAHDNEVKAHDNTVEAHDNVVEAHDNTAYVHDNTATVHDNTVNAQNNTVNKTSKPATSTSSQTKPSSSTPSQSDPKPDPTPVTPKVDPAIKAPASIRYGETIYVNLEGIDASNLLVSNKAFVKVDKISNSRVAITLTEDVDGYLTITDSVSRVNVVIDIAS